MGIYDRHTVLPSSVPVALPEKRMNCVRKIPFNEIGEKISSDGRDYLGPDIERFANISAKIITWKLA